MCFVGPEKARSLFLQLTNNKINYAIIENCYCKQCTEIWIYIYYKRFHISCRLLTYIALIEWYMVMFIDCSYLESVMHSLKSFPWSWLRSIHVREGKTYFHIWWLNFKQSLERRDFYIHAQCIYLKCVSMHKTIFMKSVFTLGYLYDACLLLLPNWAMPNSSKR